MADHTPIEWTDATWNPVVGCSIESPGCAHCYAMRMAGSRLKTHPSRAGLTKPSAAGPVWTGEVRLIEHLVEQPLRWRRPRRIFVAAHGDLFHPAVPDEWIDKVWAIMALAPQHTFQVLTKRAARMRDYLLDSDRWIRINQAMDGLALAVWNTLESPERLPLPNVWAGVSVEDQRRAYERLPMLRDTPAAVRWVSAEPLLEHVSLPGRRAWIDWLVAGGESGPRARDVPTSAFRELRDECRASGTAFFMKQMPKRAPIPPDLLIREWPRRVRVPA